MPQSKQWISDGKIYRVTPDGMMTAEPADANTLEPRLPLPLVVSHPQTAKVIGPNTPRPRAPGQPNQPVEQLALLQRLLQSR